jgi:26S proteasome regulatory subunit N1
MGKGLLGLNPLHSDKFLFSNVSLAGLITMLYTCTDMKTFLCGKYHYFLYYLVLSMYPRMLITVIYSLLMYLLVKRELGAYPDLCTCGHGS